MPQMRKQSIIRTSVSMYDGRRASRMSESRSRGAGSANVVGGGSGMPMSIINNDDPTNTMLTTNAQQLLQQQFDDALNNPIGLEWVQKPWIQRIVRICALASFISICANTPETFKSYSIVKNITYVTDMIATIVFTSEMIAKIKIKGLFKGDKPYIFDRWCQFDGIMVFFHIVSVILQTLELLNRKYLYSSLLRCPRPLILIRVIRSFLKFRLPKNRINSILQRSSSQIYNVTIFFLFFMALYGILGVQFFGELTSHCVKNGTNISHVTINDLMIPDTYCSPHGPNYGYQCPNGMECMKISLKPQDRGFNGFDEIVTSIFTVYEAASQEGWVFLMYRATDSLPSWRAFFYFITMIFFLAWLVKNVFIAVIIETFAEIRVQFQQMWGARAEVDQMDHSQVFERTANGLRLVTIDENKPKGIAPLAFQRILRSPIFNMGMLLMVLANAIITSTFKHSHKEKVDEKNLRIYYYIEIVFTLIFNLEVLFKVFCLGFRSYIKRSIYKFEFILAVGTTLRIIPYLYHTEFTYFQVLRIVRLIKSSPLLENFVNKIFGPGKKLGTLIMFTMCLLIITSCVSMQLFCFLGSEEYKKFDTFDQAFINQFAIITSEGWPETMYETMQAAGEDEKFHFYIYFMPIYFIFSHMFGSLAFMTMFQILTQKGWLDIMHSTMKQSGGYFPLVAVYFISYHLFVTLFANDIITFASVRESSSFVEMFVDIKRFTNIHDACKFVDLQTNTHENPRSILR